MVGADKVATVVPAGDIIPEDMILVGHSDLGIPLFTPVIKVLVPATGDLEFHTTFGVTSIRAEAEVIRL